MIVAMPSKKSPGLFANLKRAGKPFVCQLRKKSEVVPHPKDGDHEIPNNNRPISLPSRTFQSDREDCFESM